MPEVEGLTPQIIWYTFVGLVGICSIIILADKVADVFRKKKERDRIKNSGDELAENISKKVLESLEPRFEEINQKLANDKQIIDDHTQKLARQKDDISRIEDGNRVICRGVLALLSHEINGNSDDKLRASQAEITNYLIDK